MKLKSVYLCENIMEIYRIDNAVPFMVFHPVELIKDEIKARGMSQKELAERMGMKPSDVSRMFKEKENITPDLAAKLENALGINSSFWLRSQDYYEKDVIAIEQRDNQNSADND